MPYRPRSTDVWFNAPGVVAAYQSIGAPGPFAARLNAGNDARLSGRHTATSAQLPTWNGAAGWTFNGIDQFLTTGIAVNSNNFSAIVWYADFDTGASGYRALIGYYVDTTNTFGVDAKRGDGKIGWYNAAVLNPDIPAPVAAGVAAVAGNTAYLDGASAGTMTQGANIQDNIYIGATYYAGGAANYCGCNIRTVLICSAVLSSAHVSHYSRQMDYCHVNPDWSAWGRRRRYYYAPSATAFNSAWAQNTNRLIGGS